MQNAKNQNPLQIPIQKIEDKEKNAVNSGHQVLPATAKGSADTTLGQNMH